MGVALWCGQYGDWKLVSFIALGIGAGLANHLASEAWLLKVLESGEGLTRGGMTASTIVRLTALMVLVGGVLLVFGRELRYVVAALLALAIFRLVALVMTALPLLKELKKA
jgi:hypothetical protein